MSHRKPITRRKFISGSALTLATLSTMNLTSFAQEKSKKIRLGLIGFGQRGAGIVSITKDIQGIQFVAFCDNDTRRLAEAKKWGNAQTQYFSDYKKMLAQAQIDAVIIASPLFMHYEMCLEALKNKKHIFVEKTMTFNIDQALSLVKEVQKTDLVFQVGHQYRYYDLYYKVKEIIDKGWLGKISHIESQYNRNSDWRRPVLSGQEERVINWRLYREFSGGLVAELCAHQIDVVNWLLGSNPKKVMGLGGIDYWKDGRDIYDNIKVIYEYENGIKSCVTSVSNNQHNSYAIKILGSKGTLDIKRNNIYFYPEPVKKELGVVDGVTGATLEAIKPGEAKEIKFSSPDGEDRDPTVYALLDFINCIQNNKKPFCDVVAGKNVAIAVHMANAAMDTGNTQYWKKEYS
ncbi:Gfo/Idh/MocA family protein [Pedobacter puniceum]|uniref:Gfo/Idh/MocA family oxidoreductase n=1 Tax=Pedobacter puniceum TaxID=2666136 RepID=A0A7K0FJN2_9SPHI|nr:Gfo/Idh/MocA family oxidoreductase [Pedobacter puniceum]MRX46166.1 gfo/Idh/MocA family oxidoreductase [Pedobacter puniceum]